MPTRLLISCLLVLMTVPGQAGDSTPSTDHDALMAEHQHLIQAIVHRREAIEHSEELAEERQAHEEATEAYRSTLANHDDLQNAIRQEQRLRSTLEHQLRRRIDESPFAREAAELRSRANRTNDHLQYLRQRRRLLTSHPGSPVVRGITDSTAISAAEERVETIRAALNDALRAAQPVERQAERDRLRAQRNAAEAAIRSDDAVWAAQAALWRAEDAVLKATEKAPLQQQRQDAHEQRRQRRQAVVANQRRVQDTLAERAALHARLQELDGRRQQLRALRDRLMASLYNEPVVAEARAAAEHANSVWQGHRQRHPLAKRLGPIAAALAPHARTAPDPTLLQAGADDLERLLEDLSRPKQSPTDSRQQQSDEEHFLADTARQLLDMAAQGDQSGLVAHRAMRAASADLAEALATAADAHPLGAAITSAQEELQRQLDETNYQLALLALELDAPEGPMGAFYAEDEKLATLQQTIDRLTAEMNEQPDPAVSQARRDRDSARAQWQDLIAAHPLHPEYRAARDTLNQMTEEDRVARQEHARDLGLNEAQAALRTARDQAVTDQATVAELDRRITRTEALHKELDTQATQMEQRIEWHLSGLRLQSGPDGDAEVRRFEEQIKAQRHKIDAILATEDITALRATMESAQAVLKERTRSLLAADPQTKAMMERAQAIERTLRQAAAMGPAQQP